MYIYYRITNGTYESWPCLVLTLTLYPDNVYHYPPQDLDIHPAIGLDTYALSNDPPMNLSSNLKSNEKK